jgi:hypothetical protein
MKDHKMFEKNIERAERRVKQMDKADGFCDRDIGTIIGAFQAGLTASAEDIRTECLLDAFYMLRDLRDGLFEGRYKVSDFVRSVLVNHSKYN